MMGLSINAGVVYEDDLFFSDNSSNSLCRLNLISYQLERLDVFPCESEEYFLHRKCLINGENLYFIPNMSNNLHKYNIIEKKIQPIKIEKDCESRFNFCDALIVNGVLWILPGNSGQRVVEYELNSSKIRYHSSFSDRLEQFEVSKQLFWRSCYYEGVFLFAMLGTNKIIEFNTLNDNWCEIEVEPTNLYSIYNIDEDLYIITYKGEVYLWNYKNNSVTKADLKVDIDKEEAYIPIKISEEELYLLPCFGREILTKRGFNKFVKKEGFTLNSSGRINRIIRYENWTRWRDKALLLPAFDDDISIIANEEIIIIDSEKLNGSYKNKKYELIRSMTNEGVIWEGFLCDLSDFLDGVCR